MKAKRFFSLVLTCLLVFACLAAPAGAVVTPGVDTHTVTATGQFEATISANSIVAVGDSFILGVGDVVSYDCTYTPHNASVDYGFIAPDGYFYFFNCTSGSFSKTIRVSQRGSYTLAIRNNSDEAVTVTGTVNY